MQVIIKHLKMEIERFVELYGILIKNPAVIPSHNIVRDSIWED